MSTKTQITIIQKTHNSIPLFSKRRLTNFSVLIAAASLCGTALAGSVTTTNIFTGATVTANTTFGNAAFNQTHIVDGTIKSHMFADEPVQNYAITGFNSSIGLIRLFDEPKFSERIAKNVKVWYSPNDYSSQTEAYRLDQNNYFGETSYGLPSIDGNSNSVEDYFQIPTDPLVYSNPFNDGTSDRAIHYADILVNLPAGTRSILLQTTPSSNLGAGLTEIQAFQTEGLAVPAFAPTGLAATTDGSHVVLDWNDALNATSYSVYRSTTAGEPYGTAIATGLTTSNYTDNNVSTGSTYYYVVTSSDASSESGTSIEQSIAVVIPAPPAPTGLTCTQGDGVINLDWADSTSPQFASYSVYRSATSGGPYTSIATGLTTSAYADSTVTNGTIYYYVVRAVGNVTNAESANSAQAIGVPYVAVAGSTQPYSYFRFTPLKLRGGGGGDMIQLSEFGFIKSGDLLSLAEVTVTNPGGNSPGPGEAPEKVIDQDLGTKWLDFNIKPLVFQFPTAVTIDSYGFATANDEPGRDPVSWTLEGSLDGVSWDFIDARIGWQTTTDRNSPLPPFGISPPAQLVEKTFTYFRFTPTKLRGDNSIQLSEFAFIKSGAPLSLTGVTVTNPDGNQPGPGEAPEKVIDQDLGTKWLDLNIKPLVFQFPAAVTIDSYTFTTANDASGRDPVSWTFEGSLDGVSWEFIDVQRDWPTNPNRLSEIVPPFSLTPPAAFVDSFTASPSVVLNGGTANLTWDTSFANQVSIAPNVGSQVQNGTTNVTPPNNSDTTYTLTASNPYGSAEASSTVRTVEGGFVTYRYVRFTPYKLRRDDAPIQLAEFQILDGTNLVTPIGATNPGGNNPSEAEGASAAIDGNPGTKWLDFNKKGLVIDLGDSVSFDGYAFITGNDAPERDPMRWILEGSNDGDSWTLIENMSNLDFPLPSARGAFSQDIPLPGSSLKPLIKFFVTDAPNLVAGEPAVLNWDVGGAASVTINNGVGTVSGTGSFVVNPTVDTTYTLTANGAGANSLTATTTIQIVTPTISAINYDNFNSSGTELSLLGDAAIVNDFATIPLPGNASRLRLTPDEGSKDGTAWFRKRINFSTGFQTFFDFQFNTANLDGDGADGMVFMIQDNLTGNDTRVAGLVEDGLDQRSLNIKFDSYINSPNEPSAAYVQILAGKTVLATCDLTTVSALQPLPGGSDLTTHAGSAAPYRVRIDYVPGDLDVYFNDVQIIVNVDVNLVEIGAVNASGKGYTGFASRTGGAFESHDITRWIVEEGPPPLDLYGSWVAGKSLTGTDARQGSDPDGDGLINLLEYAFGTDPNAPTTGPLVYTSSGITNPGQPMIVPNTHTNNAPKFSAVFARRLTRTGLDYKAQFSADLVNWVDVAPPAGNQGVNNAEIEVVEVPFPATIGTGNVVPQFFRVLVTKTN